MAQQLIINTDPGADTPFSGAEKINDNFTELYRVLSSDVQAALGGTEGTPSASNPFVTNEDTRLQDIVDSPTRFITIPNECFVATTTPTYSAAVLQSGSGPFLCRIFGRRIHIRESINASKLSIYSVAIGGSGQIALKFALYTTAGTTKLADWGWTALSAGAVATPTLATPVLFRPGEYIIVYAGIVWNTKTATIRSQTVTANDWAPQLTAVAGKLGLFRSDQTISVADSSSPTALETFPSDLGTLSYTGSTFDETLPNIVIHSA